MRIWLLLIVIIISTSQSWGQMRNEAPHFIHGGDMARLVVSESTPPGAPVYTLQGQDPEGSRLHYSISGEYFTVERESGVVILRKPLDREVQDLIEVIISITDEGIDGSEANTISLRREIAILDENDNPPEFLGRPYAARIPESAEVGDLLLAPGKITVVDKDGGLNSEVRVYCVPSSAEDDICKVFSVRSERIAEGKYDVQIYLAKRLDYERRNSYVINLVAIDGASDPYKRLKTSATVIVDVLDVQDQPPFFLNAPYSVLLPENTGPGNTVLTIRAKDRDTSDSRVVFLNLEDDDAGHFDIEMYQDGPVTIGKLVTTNISLDREDPSILQNGGIYTFHVRATELIDEETPADSAVSVVTIVVTDVDDLVPTFNKKYFHLKILEDTAVGTPLPGLNMVVSDGDVGENAKYILALRDSADSPGISSQFSVSPTETQGTVPVVITAKNSAVLDFENPDLDKKEVKFEVVAMVAGKIVAVSQVHIELQDTNDHSPQFEHSIYKIAVPENSKPGSKIADITAIDEDSGDFGRVTYYLKGFGVDKFHTDPKFGGIFVTNALDYETQKSYSLTLEAKDGGGKLSAANILIELLDVNDNEPDFEQKEYSRIVREGATSLDPQLFVRATDADGYTQGDGKIQYALVGHNSVTDGVFKINSHTGEITIQKPTQSVDTERGTYELTIKATDAGIPPLSSEAKVLIRVGVPGNQKPVFKGNYKLGIPGPSTYRAKVFENALPGTEVVKVVANDPDGRDSLLQYQIASGAKDNFVINSRSGIITVSPDARLDLETNGRQYDIVVHAIDSGTPVRETATTTVTVQIEDVNNKPPSFKDSSYIIYVSEKTPIGEQVLKMTAIDPDANAKLEYSIVEPIKAVDKTGVALKNTANYDYKHAFKINATTGVVSVNRGLDYQSVAVIILTVQAKDLNASIDRESQIAKTEVTIYIQAYSDDNPVFTNSGWSPNNPTIKVTVPEEQPLGTTLLMLSAKETPHLHAIQRFELIRDDFDEGYVNVGVQSGNVVLSKRLDYETLKEKFIKFKVRALARDYDITHKMSEANVIVQVQDINDNSPIFDQKEYNISVRESEKSSKVVLTVRATDGDSAKTEEEIKRGYGVVRYALTGENANMFVIDPVSGQVRIALDTDLDREWQSALRFYVVASDMPQGGGEQRSTRVLITVNIQDVNDNAPVFSQSTYTGVIPENTSAGVNVIKITATDADEGQGGSIHYEIIDEGEASGLFQINATTGEITTAKELTGKGRTQPYTMRIRAQDNGEPILFTDTELILYIGDVVNNDGVPLFIRPTVDEIAYIAENSTIGSPVFQVIASDPDDPNMPKGKIVFHFLEDGNFDKDASSFRINRESGLITTRKLLDRETKDKYNLVIVAQDLGDPPQQATRVLQVSIVDIDDHKPHFKRNIYNQPWEIYVDEEGPVNSTVGVIQAVDEDIGDNGKIDYAIVYGNEAGMFGIERIENNSAVIRALKRLDRESMDQHLLTIKCFKYPVKKSDITPKPYNKQDPSERQVLIKVNDIDDNKPQFKKENFTLGVRLNVPIDTSLITLEATDPDADALPINYHMGKASFVSLVDPSSSKTDIQPCLSLNNITGELRTIASMSNFADGYIQVPISANNSAVPGRQTNVTLRIFLLRDRDMLKFVFTKPPVEVRKTLEDFEKAVQQALSLPVSINVYDTQFYSKDDNSLDFSSTSSCFQMVGKEVYDLHEKKLLLTDPRNDELKKVYKQFHVDKVQHCATSVAKAEVSMLQIWVLAIAAFVGVSAIVASYTLCCLHAKYKKQLRQIRMREQTRPSLSYVSSGPGMISSGSHTTLGPATNITISPHEPPYEWGADTTLYHPSTLSRA